MSVKDAACSLQAVQLQERYCCSTCPAEGDCLRYLLLAAIALGWVADEQAAQLPCTHLAAAQPQLPDALQLLCWWQKDAVCTHWGRSMFQPVTTWPRFSYTCSASPCQALLCHKSAEAAQMITV